MPGPDQRRGLSSHHLFLIQRQENNCQKMLQEKHIENVIRKEDNAKISPNRIFVIIAKKKEIMQLQFHEPSRGG